MISNNKTQKYFHIPCAVFYNGTAEEIVNKHIEQHHKRLTKKAGCHLLQHFTYTDEMLFQQMGICQKNTLRAFIYFFPKRRFKPILFVSDWTKFSASLYTPSKRYMERLFHIKNFDDLYCEAAREAHELALGYPTDWYNHDAE